MKSNLLFPIILQLLGIIIILAEFVIPSAGILTVGAICVFGYSLYMVYQSFSIQVCMMFVCVDLIMLPFLIWLGVRILASSPLTLKNTLSTSHNTKSDNSDLIGKSGIALTRLIPAGKALIDENRFDVISPGDYINKDEEITVTSVNGNRIVVKKKI